MHYYKRNIGDYAKKAGRLSILQHGVYNLLIDACYDREQFPTRDEAIDWVWASNKDEIEAVDFVLGKFFSMDDKGRYIQKRIKESISEYQIFCQDQAEKGKKGGRPKNQDKETQKKPNGINKKPNGLLKEPDGIPNESRKKPKPRTTNQEPLTSNHKPSKRFVPPTVLEVQDYCNQRGNSVDADRFVNFYESKGWLVGKSKMKSWQACVRNWEKDDKPPRKRTVIDIAQDFANG